jgi:hypothetical protein
MLFAFFVFLILCAFVWFVFSYAEIYGAKAFVWAFLFIGVGLFIWAMCSDMAVFSECNNGICVAGFSFNLPNIR